MHGFNLIWSLSQTALRQTGFTQNERLSRLTWHSEILLGVSIDQNSRLENTRRNQSMDYHRTGLLKPTTPKHTLDQHMPHLQQCKHPLIGTTLQTFKTTCLLFRISSSPGPLTPIRHNPDFYPGTDRSFLLEFWTHPDPKVGDFFSEGIVTPLPSQNPLMTNHQSP